MPGKRPRPADYEERLRAAEDLARCYCVEASAGTGKTTLLTDRFLNLIKAGATVDRMVAITFTEMAAAELKVRIRDGLEEERCKTEDALVAERLARALLQMEGAQISTIHSFAARLLRERPVEAGVDPFFETMDNIQADLLFQETWADWLEGNLQREDSAFARPLRLGASLDRIEALARCYYENRDLEPAAPPTAPIDAAPTLKALTGGVGRLAGMAEEGCLDYSDRGWQSIARLQGVVASLRESQPEERLLELLRAITKIPTTAGDAKKWKSGRCKEQKELCAELEARRAEAAARIGAFALHQLLRELGSFLDAMREAKRARGVLDFQDLLILARDLLRDDLTVRRYFQQQFDHLLVDEFQDTDPLQAEIIFFLAEAEPRAATWTEVKLGPGKLFIVGDPKQSIYRFRRADIEIYERAKAVVAAQGASATIFSNWRSSVSVIDWVNHVCGILIQPCEDGNYQPAYIPLAPSPQAPDHTTGTVLLVPPEDAVLEKAADARAAEAECIAASIRLMLDQGWPVRDRQEGCFRPVRPGDIALLFPGTTEIETFEQALQARGIGYQFEGGKRFHFRREVRDLGVMLAALDNPEDELAVVGALQSLFFGISNRELAGFRADGGRFNYLRPGPMAPDLLGQAFEQMARLHAMRHSLSLPALVEMLLEETQVREFLMFLPRGEQAVMNLDKIVAMVRYLDSSGRVTLRGLVRWLGEMEAGRAEEPEMVSDEMEGAVHIMTIHKAKGLEFSAVVIANMGASSSGSESLVADRLGGRFFTRLSRDKDFPIYSAGWRAAKEEEARRRSAERQRLFYVAATRARDYLLVPLFSSETPQGYIKDLLPLREGFDPLVEAGSLKEVTMAEIESSQRPERSPAPEAQSKAAEAQRGTPPSRADCLARLEALKAGNISPWRRETPSAEKDRPEETAGSFMGRSLKMGSALHALMEQADLTDPAGVEVLAAGLALVSGISEQTARLVELGRNCLGSEVIRRAARSSRALREVPFTLLEEGRLVEGRIDLLFEEDGELVLVDYKTDAVAEKDLPERAEHYRRQGELYAEAAAAICGKPVKEVIFLFAAIPEEVSLSATSLK